MRKLASIVEIETCDPIEGTDRLSVATMKGKGWKVVTSRDEFAPGDLAVYFEIDAALPADDERYSFLRERCLRKFVSKSGQVLREVIRIKTVKLRGVISQGLLMPLSAFVGEGKEISEKSVPPKFGDLVDENGVPVPEDEVRKMVEDGFLVSELTANGEVMTVGSDLTEILHVEHIDEIAEQLRPMTSSNPISADAYGKFPTDFIPKTDEERIQNLTDYFTKMKGRRFEITEKNDGSSVTMFLSKTVDSENPFGVCTRNIRLKPQTESGIVPLAWRMAKKYNVESAIAAAEQTVGAELAFQGELVGPGVNGNRDKYADFEWHVFKVWNITVGRYLLPEEARALCRLVHLEYVPVICESMDVFDTFVTVDDLLKYAEGKTAAGNEREGLVFKSVDEPYVSFKAVSNRYLMKIES